VPGSDGLSKSVEKMRADGVPDLAIRNFEHHYELLAKGDAGMLAESEIEPVESVPDADDLPDGGDAARDALDRTVVLKLNGGLGTSMGMTRAKSLLEAKDGLSFLDVIARQVLHLRHTHDAPLPLIFMNSFRTSSDTMDALARYADLPVDGLPLEFLQNREPKLLSKDLSPVSFPKKPRCAAPGCSRA
jgi:UTP--glucose-1-phosphate uridylyltransferase